MSYSVMYEEKAIKQISKLDNSVKQILKKWIEKNLVGTEDPRKNGKPLTGNKSGYWRYRIGDYRLIAEIRDEQLLIIAVAVAHRSQVYNE